MTSFILVWSLMGATGAIFCIAALGGLDALPAFTPFSLRGALRLLVACAIGGAGGYAGGWVIQGNNAAISTVNYSVGIAWGAALGAFLGPFTTFGLYHLLEYRLRKTGAMRSSLGWRLMGSAGWVTVLVAPLLGFLVGEHLGGALGSADSLLASVAAPFTAGVVCVIIPLLFWLIGRADSCYVWTSETSTQVPESDPARIESVVGN